MPQDAEISNDELQKSLGRSRFLARCGVILAICGATIAWVALPSKPKTINWVEESTGPSIIRYYGDGMRMSSGNTTSRADLLFVENYNGSAKILQPICQSQLGVHSHMRVDIQFHWAPYQTWHSGRGPEAGEECYSIDKITSIGADEK